MRTVPRLSASLLEQKYFTESFEEVFGRNINYNRPGESTSGLITVEPQLERHKALCGPIEMPQSALWEQFSTRNFEKCFRFWNSHAFNGTL